MELAFPAGKTPPFGAFDLQVSPEKAFGLKAVCAVKKFIAFFL